MISEIYAESSRLSSIPVQQNLSAGMEGKGGERLAERREKFYLLFPLSDLLGFGNWESSKHGVIMDENNKILTLAFHRHFM